MKKTVWAFAPAGISSFFEICDRTADGTPITDLEHVGARGGGFGLKKGVLTAVSVSEPETSRIRVYINGRLAPEAETTRTALQMLLNETKGAYDVVAKHEVEVPIGAGFGTSAGGTLSASLALSKALNLPLTFNQIGKTAHVAEVMCKTGLGTVGPLMISGCVLTVEPGAPGISVIDRIPLSSEYVLVTGVFGPIHTKKVLSSAEKRSKINKYGRKTFEAIMAEPTLENLLACSWDFAKKVGFATQRVRQLVHLAEETGAVGAAQNMIGEAVHAVVYEENAVKIAEAFKQLLPNEKILIAEIDVQGARLVENEKV